MAVKFAGSSSIRVGERYELLALPYSVRSLNGRQLKPYRGVAEEPPSERSSLRAWKSRSKALTSGNELSRPMTGIWIWVAKPRELLCRLAVVTTAYSHRFRPRRSWAELQLFR